MAKTLLENENSSLDVSATIKLGNLDSSYFSNSNYKYLYVALSYQEEILGDFKTLLFSDYTYNSIINTQYYYLDMNNNKIETNYSNPNDNIGSLYLGVSHFNYGRMLYGKTPSVYYNGFIGSWFEPNGLGGIEVINPSFNADLLGTKNPDNTLFYNNNIDTLKLSFQISGGSKAWQDMYKVNNNASNDNISNLSRDYGFGTSAVYAIGPLYMGASYLNTKMKDNLTNINYNFQMSSIGVMFNLLGIYTSFATIYENNRFAENTEAFGLSYLISYDNKDDGLGFIPQLTYGYKKYLDSSFGNPIAYNYVYTSVFYYLSTSFALFSDIKWDLRTANNVSSTQNFYDNFDIKLQFVKEHSFLFGIKYDLY